MPREHMINYTPQNGSSTKKSATKIKVCGMKEAGNIKAVANLQPDYLGFIFYKNTPRYFRGTIPELPSNVKKVGVFVNATHEDIVERAKKHLLDVVQLHGEESPEFCSILKDQLSQDISILKVFSIKEQFDFEQLKPYETICDYFLFDTKGKLPGGNGYMFNWDVLKNYPSTTPYFLSGGIGLAEIENLQEFLQRPESQYCHAIDVNSKFEIDAGLKNITLLKKFKNRINQSTQTR